MMPSEQQALPLEHALNQPMAWKLLQHDDLKWYS
jgi:hypothetical protein